MVTYVNVSDRVSRSTNILAHRDKAIEETSAAMHGHHYQAGLNHYSVKKDVNYLLVQSGNPLTGLRLAQSKLPVPLRRLNASAKVVLLFDKIS